MKNYYCLIKCYNSDLGYWDTFIKDYIQADDKKSAREIIQENFDKILPMRIQKKNIKKDSLLLQLYEHKGGAYFSKDFFKEKKCICCGKLFRMVERYNLTGSWGDSETCSDECKNIEYKKRRSERDIINDNFNDTQPVIYKITQISSGKCYIGKTTRSYTLRWWEHIKSKEWISKDETDFTYQLLEILPKKTKNEKILEIESNYISKYDSIKNGFNSVISKKDFNNDQYIFDCETKKNQV